ncbi:hypothetical protein B6U90_06565 [Thermoplasmatales archaeon ex4484_6]|nr:MAG: hypothetical protein B6U90_06565 [Thermoplasmatales archaeon ex4484_6]
MDFDPVERYLEMSSEEIYGLQNRKLRDFIRFQLYPFSPHYRKLFDSNGIDPNSIRTVRDLEKLPLTRKVDIMPDEGNPKKYKDFILQPDPEKIRKYWKRSKLIGMKLRDLVGGDLKRELQEEYYPNFMIATSGTTGNNVPFMFTHRDYLQFSNAYASAQQVVGMEDDWVVLNTFPFAPHLAFIFAYWVNLNSTLRIFHTGGGAVTSTDKAVDLINIVDVNVLLGIPSYIYHLLRKAQERGEDLSSIRMVMTAGEKLTKGTRQRMEEILKDGGAEDVRIFDVYGTTEMRDAYPECVPGSGVYHIHPNLHIAEIVDPESGKQKRPGERGALAITNIDGRGSVVLRFLIGDIFEGGIQYGRCPLCGSSVPRLVGPIGRLRDYSSQLEMTKVKGTLVNLNTFYEIMPGMEGVLEWQVSIEKRNNDPSDLDVLRINIAPSKDADPGELEKMVKARVNDALEINPIVDTSFEEDTLFELMGGKIKVARIVDNRPKE